MAEKGLTRDAQARQTAASDGHRAEGGRLDAGTATGSNPLDRPDAGEGGGSRPSFGTTYHEAHQLAPHRIRTFKLSTDPKFAEKFTDVVGLYVDPPAHAVVLSVDEKSHMRSDSA